MTCHVSELVSRLEAACVAYYNEGEPTMSDAEYDAAVDELRATDPKHPFLLKVGAPLEEDGFPHDSPVGSQEKLKTEDEFNRWCDKVEALHDPSVGPTYVIQWKLDEQRRQASPRVHRIAARRGAHDNR
jgi:NAD-dependent DNA ligase